MPDEPRCTLPSRPAPPPASGHGGPWGREVPWPGPPSRGGDAVAGPRKECVCGVGPSSAQPPTARRPRLAHAPLPGSPARSHVLPRPCRGPTVFGQAALSAPGAAAEHGAPPRARAHHPAAPAPAPPGAPSPAQLCTHDALRWPDRHREDRWMEGRKEEGMDGWVYGRMDAQVDRQMDGQRGGWRWGVCIGGRQVGG